MFHIAANPFLAKDANAQNSCPILIVLALLAQTVQST